MDDIINQKYGPSFDINYYRKSIHWPNDIERRFGDTVATVFVMGAEIILDAYECCNIWEGGN